MALRWLTVLLSIGISTLLGLIFRDSITVGGQLMLFLPAVFVSALYGGWLPGVAASILGAMATIAFHFPPAAVEPQLTQNRVGLLLYGLACAIALMLSRAQEKQRERISLFADELEIRVAQRTAELQAAHDELAGFCYSISHDLRSPMRNIVGSSRILIDDLAVDVSDEAKERMESMAASAQKLSRLVDDLLGYARLSGAEIQPKWIDLTKLSEDLCRDLQRDSWSFTSLDCQAEPGLITGGDPVLVSIVVRQLMENACKYAKPNQQLQIQVGEARLKGRTWFFVRDNGIGFEMQYAQKIFEPFQRLHRDTDYPGTGIGLANVKRIVERHDGEIFATSELGRGATFYFSFGGMQPAGPKPASRQIEPKRVLMADEA